ncbi:MAG: hypothetical protein AAF945_14470 [Actinomycetota bacterium]
MNGSPQTRPRSWWQAWFIDRRARRQVPSERLPALAGASTHLVQHAEAVDDVAAAYTPVAGDIARLRSLLPERDRRRTRERELRAIADRAADVAGRNDLAAWLWIGAWPFVTALDFVLARTVLSMLFVTVDGLTLELVIAGFASGTLAVAHEAGTAIQLWRTSERLTVRQRRRCVAAIALVGCFVGLVVSANVLTGQGSDKHVAGLLAVFIPTAFYSVKPTASFVGWLWWESQARIARDRSERTARTCDGLVEGIVEGRDRTVLAYWAALCRADASRAAWGLDESPPTRADVDGYLERLSAAGVVPSRDEIDAVLHEYADDPAAADAPSTRSEAASGDDDPHIDRLDNVRPFGPPVNGERVS